MKNTVYLLIFILSFLLSCNNNSDSSDVNLIESSSTANNPQGKGKEPIITFERESWDFGDMIEGEVVEHEFSFTNTGGKTLLISDVKASCGCTIPEWPKEPIKSGKGGVIKVRFNSAGKSDKIEKHVTIYANTTPITKDIYFTAFVKKNPNKEEK
jgi:hypothetical protein